jgi:3-oxosteroid 1-dehydrogenase
MKSNRQTRRDFIKTTAVGVGATALAGLGATEAKAFQQEAFQLPIDDVPRRWDYEADVVACGYGATGSAAALEAHDAGAEVLILEKNSLPGGSMGRCGGGIMGAGTQIQKALGIDDSPDTLYDWLVVVGEGLTRPDIARVFADECGKNVDWLMKLGVDYGVGAPVPTQKGSLGTGGVDGLGAPYSTFNFPVTARSHWATPKTKGHHAGPELFTPFYMTVRAKGINALFETRLVKLITSDRKEVLGVVAESKGKTLYVKARKGVVLGTGGFPANTEMKRKFNPDMAVPTYMCPDCTGEGIIAAMALGADLDHMSLSYPMPGPYNGPSDPDTPYNNWDIGPTGLPRGNTIMAETHGGVIINTQAQVIDVYGDVIPRLYASGCAVGSNVFGKPGRYPGCGCYVGFAVCFGRIGGKNAALATSWS